MDSINFNTYIVYSYMLATTTSNMLSPIGPIKEQQIVLQATTPRETRGN